MTTLTAASARTSRVAGLDASDELLEEAAGGALVQPPPHIQEVEQLARLSHGSIGQSESSEQNAHCGLPAQKQAAWRCMLHRLAAQPGQWQDPKDDDE